MSNLLSYRVLLNDGTEVGRLLISKWCRIDLKGKSFRISAVENGESEDGFIRNQGSLAVELVGPGIDFKDLPLREARELFEQTYLASQILHFKGNISRTAEFVGMERSSLHRKMRGLGITEPTHSWKGE